MREANVEIHGLQDELHLSTQSMGLVPPTYGVHFIVARAPMFHQVINLSCKNAYDMHILYVPLTTILFSTQK